MKQKAIDLGGTPVGRLFRQYLIPTLLGMVSMCFVTMADGIFVGRFVGPAGVAAVNIVWAPMMLLIGLGLMLGIGCSVVASIRLAHGETERARKAVTQALATATLISTLAVILMMASPASTCRLLGSSDALMPLCVEYLLWMSPALVLNLWSIIGLFIVRLDGSPKYAMWCNVLPGLINIALDFLFVYIMDMGLKGAALATSVAIATGAGMAMWYLGAMASQLRLKRLPLDGATLKDTWRNVLYQMRIGISAFLGEATMAMLMFIGNRMFMLYLGDDGVAAFGIACYYCPFFFMIGNATAQSAQPIISYNYGLGAWDRVRATETLAIKTALGFGVAVTALFVFCPRLMTELFIDPTSQAAVYAIEGLPWFASCVLWFIFNVTAIGYFQSVERVVPSVAFALMRGVLCLVPAFILVPMALGTAGLWLAVAFSEALTSMAIILFYICNKRKG